MLWIRPTFRWTVDQPLSMLLGLVIGKAVLQHFDKAVLLIKIAVPLVLSLAAIRLIVYILRKAFRPGPAMKAWESVISNSVRLGNKMG